MELPDIELNSLDAEGGMSPKRKILTILIIGVIILTIPFAVRLVQEQQALRSRAAGEDVITFKGDGVSKDAAGNWTTTSREVQIEIKSPFGGPADATGSPTITRPVSGLTRLYVEPTATSSGRPITVTATGPTSCSTNLVDVATFGAGITGCTRGGGFTCTDPNPKNDGNACWYKWSCRAGPAGSYTAKFNASGSNCLSTADYVIR